MEDIARDTPWNTFCPGARHRMLRTMFSPAVGELAPVLPGAFDKAKAKAALEKETVQSLRSLLAHERRELSEILCAKLTSMLEVGEIKARLAFSCLVSRCSPSFRNIEVPLLDELSYIPEAEEECQCAEGRLPRAAGDCLRCLIRHMCIYWYFLAAACKYPVTCIPPLLSILYSLHASIVAVQIAFRAVKNAHISVTSTVSLYVEDCAYIRMHAFKLNSAEGLLLCSTSR